MARVLVTGGAGFIGSHLVRALMERGDEVIVLDDLSTGRQAALPAGAALVEADIANPGTADLVAATRPQIVLHAAAQASVPASVADPERDRAVNVEGTRHVLRGAADAGARRFVFLSTGGAMYGDTLGASEDDPPQPVSPYGQHKLEAEGLVAASGLSYGIARIANVYGPGQSPGLEGAVVAAFVERVRAGDPVTIHGDGLQTRDFVHVTDLVRGLLAIADARLDGTWNLGSGQAHSVLDILAAVERALGRRVARRAGPSRPGDVRHSRLLVGKAARDLGWRAEVSLDAGIAELLSAERD